MRGGPPHFPATPEAIEIHLDPHHAARDKASRHRRLNVVVYPVTRLIGNVLLIVVIYLNNRFVLDEPFSWPTFLGISAVLMDVHMPEMDGLQATAAIRGRERVTGGHLPIVAMTASAMKGDRERCLAAGMDGYVSKPVRSFELFETIEACSAAESVPGAAEDEDATEDRVTHTLKSSAGHFSSTAAGAALRLERMGREGSLSGAIALADVLEREVAEVWTALETLRAGPTPS